MPCLMMSEQLGCRRQKTKKIFPFVWHHAQISFKQNSSHSKLLPCQLKDRSALRFPQCERIFQTIFVFMTSNIWINMLIWCTDSHHKSAKPRRIHILKFTSRIYTNKSTKISVYNMPYWFKLATGLLAALVLGLIDLWENKYLFTQSAVFSIVSCSPMEQV